MAHMIQLALDGFGAKPVGYCSRCGRRLTDPVSVERGMGQVCASKSAAQAHGHENETNVRHVDTPIALGVVLRRDKQGNIHTNAPHLVRHHSPTGLEFGYAGSGPADLSLNIIEAVLRQTGYSGEKTEPLWDGNRVFQLAWNLHQAFKFDVIAPLQGDEHIIDYPAIQSWLEAHIPQEMSSDE